jgi:uncharacterized protein (DUF305 family)
MSMKSLSKLLACALLVLPATARAEDDPHAGHQMPMDHMNMEHMDHAGMDHGAKASAGDASPSAKAYEAADAKMHQNMTMEFTGDADVDFFRGMIPHHQGAIDMAKVELQYGKDPEARKMAEDIVKAQETEIAVMKAWLEKKGK